MKNNMKYMKMLIMKMRNMTNMRKVINEMKKTKKKKKKEKGKMKMKMKMKMNEKMNVDVLTLPQ